MNPGLEKDSTLRRAKVRYCLKIYEQMYSWKIGLKLSSFFPSQWFVKRNKIRLFKITYQESMTSVPEQMLPIHRAQRFKALFSDLSTDSF